MSRVSIYLPCCAAALLALPHPVIAADEKTPPPAVGARLRAFAETLNGMAPAAKKLMEGPPEGKAFKPGDMVTLIEKTCAVSTQRLPDDLAKAFAEFCEHGRRMADVLKGLPNEVPGTGRKEWMEALEKSDPAAAKRFREFPVEMEKLDAASSRTSWRLEMAALRHGVNVRAFLDPDSIGRKLLTPARGKTTPEDFAAALREIPAKRQAAIAGGGKLGKTMARLAHAHQSEAELLFAVPVDGLPDELAAAYAGYGRVVEKLAWFFGEYPADMPFERAGIDAYFAEAKKKDKDFEKSVLEISARIKTQNAKKEETLAALVSKAGALGLDIGGFAPAKPAQAKPQ